MVSEAPDSTPAWAKLWSLESLRYQNTGWWLDRILPHSPIGLVAVAIALPLVWFACGYAVTADRATYLATPDILGQLWFLPLHLVTLRLVGGLWGRGLVLSLDGLALDAGAEGRIKRGAFGNGASLGALVAAAAFTARDFWYGLTASPSSGLNAFDDPDMWDMAKLGRPVHGMLLGLWTLEWLLFGYLLWLQLWVLIAWSRELRRHDFRDHLLHVLVGDGYRHSFALFGKTTTVCLVFALANLGFIAYTGELIPRDAVEIDGFFDFLQNMSDVLSTTLLFLLALVAVISFVTQLRGGLTRAVNREFATAGNIALTDMATPMALTGDAEADVIRLRARVEAQSGLVRAIVFQREVDKVGGRTMVTVGMKALIPLVTTALKIAKMQVKGG